MTTLRKSLPFSIALILPALGLQAAVYLGMHMALVPLVVFGLIPVLDALCGRDTAPLEDESHAAAWRDWRYDIWLWLWIPAQLAVLFLAGRAVASHRVDSLGAFAGLALATGLVGGLGINVGHELMHRKGRLERALAELLLTATTYTHFCIEHVHGHHRHVATPLDPASARLGESVYAFLPRTLLGSLRSAWRIETERVQKLKIPKGSLRDRRLRYPLVLALVYAALLQLGGVRLAGFFALQSAVAFTLLEVINYIEHYGLSRRELEPGRYERCMPRHSWNASQRLTNWFLFELQRHADHHYMAGRPYFALRHIDDSPQLPAGYATMVVLALVPPLYRKVMDGRVDAWNRLNPAAPTPAPSHGTSYSQ